jgi:arylformamidase
MILQRRRVLWGAVTLAVGALPMTVLAQQKVFLDYTQEQLDQAYDQSFWTPQLNELQADDGRFSAEIRKSMPPKTVRYGKTEIEQVDIFAPPNARNAPVFVYFHGGAWLFNSRLDGSFPAPSVVPRGGILLVPDFNNIKQARLPDIIEQCRSVVEWAARNAESFGGDPSRIYVGGHSSGAHLTGCVLITEWAKRGLPADTIKGGLVMSGMYELYPAMLSSRGKYVQITKQEEDAASVMRHLDRIACPVAVAWAVSDSVEFRRQSAVFAEALGGMGRLASRTEIFAANHFTEPRQLGDPNSELSRILQSLMKL